MSDDYEVWPRTFKSAAHAVSWADNYLAGAGERNLSQLGAEVKGRNRSQTLPEMDRHGALVTCERLQNQAETISVALSAVDKPPGVLYRHIHGRHNRTIEIASQLAHLVWDGPENGKTIAKMRAVALMAVKDKQAEHKNLVGRVPATLIAANIGVSWVDFKGDWLPYLRQMQDHLSAWMDRAERQLEQDLVEKGIL